MNVKISPSMVVEWEQVACALFAHNRIPSGLWHVGVMLHMTGTTTPWLAEDAPGKVPEQFPTALVGLGGLSLTKTDTPGPMIFDAALAAEGKPCATGRMMLIEDAPVKKAPRKRSAAKKPLDPLR